MWLGDIIATKSVQSFTFYTLNLPPPPATDALLGRHLDDAHGEVEEAEKDDVKTWFRKSVLKAKQQFQPVAVLNQKLKGLDIFESNAIFSPSPPSNGLAILGSGGTPAQKATQQDPRDPDELVTRSHWQRTTSNDFCLDPTCRKPLGVVNGCVNCVLFASGEFLVKG